MYKSLGFSLVELAIVLVIIGLITGGILTGQDLIRSSELNSIVMDTNKIRVAINTFKIKYNALPGDIPNGHAYFNVSGGTNCLNALPTTTVFTGCNGDGDGQIETAVTPNEDINVFFHLSLGGTWPGSYIKTPGVPASYVQESDLKSFYFWVVNDTSALFGFSAPSNPLIIQIGGHTGQFWGPPVTPGEAASIDGKADDSLPRSGKIRATHGYSGGAWLTSCYTGTAFIFSTSSASCVLAFNTQ